MAIFGIAGKFEMDNYFLLNAHTNTIMLLFTLKIVQIKYQSLHF